MMKLIRLVAAAFGLGLGWIATAQVPGWYLDQVYTNADSSVQYVVFLSYGGGQQHLAGSLLTAAPQRGYGGRTHTFNFPSDLPGDSANRRMLIATQRFADLHLVEPDYVVPNGFFPATAGLIGIDDDCCVPYFAPPTDGVNSLQNPDHFGLRTTWVVGTAIAANFAGEQYVFTEPPPPRPPTAGWVLDEIYSSANGSVQFIVLSTTDRGEQLLGGSKLVVTKLASRWSWFTFPKDLPTNIDTANRSLLVATEGFANMHVLKPDYVVPNGFFPANGGHIQVAGKDYDIDALPKDGVNALQLQDPVPGQSTAWTVDTAVAINFAGQQYVFAPTSPPPPPPVTPPKLVGLSLDPSSVVGSATSTATVRLSGPATAGGAVVTLTSSNRIARAPPSVVVPAGSTSAPFTVTTSSVSGKTLAKIGAAYGGVKTGAVITVTRH